MSGLPQYVTLDDLVARFGMDELIQITDTVPPYTGAVNPTRLQMAIAMAVSEVEGYVSGRYALPLTQVPPFLKGITCDMVRYHLLVGAARTHERDETRYKAACATLSKISKGEIQLGAASLPAGGTALLPEQPGAAMVSGRGAVWGRGDW